MQSFDERLFDWYPRPEEVDAWADGIRDEATRTPLQATAAGPYLPGSFGQFHAPGTLVRFDRAGHGYWGVWHGKPTGSPAPLVVHMPGYGAELSCHWDVAARGYALLQVSPLGYWTPDGFDDSLRRDGNWPVLPDTARTLARGGYRDWLLDVACAVCWAWSQPGVQPGRVTFYGTSQGGGGALLMGSVFAGRGTACVCADEPFLTDYPLAAFRGAYEVLRRGIEDAAAAHGEQAAWHAAGFADTLCHAHRMDYPVLLTAAGKDEACPPETVEALYRRLPQTKSLSFWHDHAHGYNPEFIRLACAWFSLYA